MPRTDTGNMKISSLTASAAGRTAAERVSRPARDIETTAKQAPARSAEVATRTDEGSDVVQRSSARVAAFEQSVEARFDQILKSGDLSPRQTQAVEEIKSQFSSMLNRLDSAFFGADGLEGGASEALQKILELTGGALESVIGPQDGGPITPTEQSDGTAGSIDTVA